jgi:hypothetical protein
MRGIRPRLRPPVFGERLPGATRMSDARIGALDVDDTTSRSAPASVTSRSTSVMAVASVSWRCRARALVRDALLSSASGRDIPAVANA